MAHSRSERIGTIFSRMTALWERKAITEDNLPLWYDVYKAFPPKYEPRFDRPAPQEPVRNIFYQEDLIRAKFQKDVFLPVIDLKSQKLSQSQLFYIMYENLKQLGFKEEEVYDKVMHLYESAFSRSVKHSADKSNNSVTKTKI